MARFADRRRFLSRISAAATSISLAHFGDDALRVARAAAEYAHGRDPDELARDEDFWRPIQQAFTVDRTYINLNNGGVCPSPRIVQEAMKRALDMANTAPSHQLWRVQEPRKEQVRRQLARMFGCSPEEIAVTRNASEALETCILGLDLEPGDEVVACDQNYPRMLQTWRQREARDGIRLKTFPAPTNPSSKEELFELVVEAVTEKTRVIEVCHVTNLNGQIWPVREICRFGRERGIEVIVDGAHAFAHFPFERDDLECDYYGTSLHKWLCASHGTGFLYVRKEKIRDLWPLMAPPNPKSEDIRKFEEIGTHPAANHNAIAEAVVFHEGIGSARKAARLRHLNRRWIAGIEGRRGARVLTNDADDQSCGLRLLHLPGLDPAAVGRTLLERYGIITTTIRHRVGGHVSPPPPGERDQRPIQFEGLRITPNVYTTLEEIDRFVDAVHRIQDRGLPR